MNATQELVNLAMFCGALVAVGVALHYATVAVKWLVGISDE